MNMLFQLVLWPTVVGGSIAMYVGVARCILGPLDRAARNRECPAQFTLADFLCLFVLIQLSMILPHWLATLIERNPVYWLFAGYGWASAAALWWFSVRSLHKSGVVIVWHRAVFLTLAIPVTIVTSAGIPAVAVFVVLMFRELNFPGDVFRALGAELLLAFFVVVCSYFTRYIIAHATPPTPSLPSSSG